MSNEPHIVTAADVVSDDPSFCCPLVGLYPCERELRGCYCHESHLQEARRLAVLEGKAERPGPPYDLAYEQNQRRG